MDTLPRPPKARARRLSACFLACSMVGGLFITAVQAGGAFAQQPPTSTVTPEPEPSPTPDPQPPPPPPPPPPSYPPLPEGSGDGRRVVYSNSAQRVWLVEGSGEVASSWQVSGRKGMPRPGTYKVFSKSRHSSASGGRLRMEYMVRFARGRRLAIGFHSIPVTRRGAPIQSESELGHFRSAGCVRQRLSDAQRLWEWAPTGTKVVVTR